MPDCHKQPYRHTIHAGTNSTSSLPRLRHPILPSPPTPNPCPASPRLRRVASVYGGGGDADGEQACRYQPVTRRATTVPTRHLKARCLLLMSCTAEFGADAAHREVWASSAKDFQQPRVSSLEAEQGINEKKTERYVGKLAVFNQNVEQDEEIATIDSKDAIPAVNQIEVCVDPPKFKLPTYLTDYTSSTPGASSATSLNTARRTTSSSRHTVPSPVATICGIRLWPP